MRFGRKKQNGRCGQAACSGVPLSAKRNCGRARVCSITGDRKHCARLAALGLYPGNEIELISPPDGERCLVKVHGGTISIDRDTLEHIVVTD
jgi:ferrous iron transport protein A